MTARTAWAIVAQIPGRWFLRRLARRWISDFATGISNAVHFFEIVPFLSHFESMVGCSR
jgi:hypothetical protein